MDQGEAGAMVTLYQSVIPILQIHEYTTGKTNELDRKGKQKLINQPHQQLNVVDTPSNLKSAC